MSEAKKISKTAVQVGEFVYIFETEDEADAFLVCLHANEIDVCENMYRHEREHISKYTSDDDEDGNDGGGSPPPPPPPKVH